MQEKSFKEVELKFTQLRKQFLRGELTREQFAGFLKELRLLDREGRCWMLGAQSGKWYYYDGKNWIQSEPPDNGRDRIICPDCHYQNDPETRTCERCGAILVMTSTKIACQHCGSLISMNLNDCPFCGQPVSFTITERLVESQKKSKEPTGRIAAPDMVYLSSIDQKTFLFFLGGLGIFIGILLGLLVGSTSFFPGLVSVLPDFLKEMQGKLIGGLVFSFLGGVLGFLLGAVSGFILALLLNYSIYFFGRPGFRLERARKKVETK